jgi:hypothetical protein
MTLVSIIIVIPLLIQGGLILGGRIIIEEEMLEMLLIMILLAIAYLVSKKYESLLRENHQRIEQLATEQRQLTSSLSEAFHYIGTVNVEVAELQKLVFDLDRYPHTKNDFKNVLCVLADKTMALTRSEWAIIRIIGLDHLRTLKECRRGKIEGETLSRRVSNRAISIQEKVEGLSIIESRQRSPHIKTVCIAGACDLPAEARRAVEAITNGCLEDSIGVDAAWPLFIQQSTALSMGYIETEGLEFETGDRFADQIAAAGSYENWMTHIDGEPHHWAHRLNLARIEVEAMFPYSQPTAE